MDTIFIKAKNSKTTEPHRFRLYFTDIIRSKKE